MLLRLFLNMNASFRSVLVCFASGAFLILRCWNFFCFVWLVVLILVVAYISCNYKRWVSFWNLMWDH